MNLNLTRAEKAERTRGIALPGFLSKYKPAPKSRKKGRGVTQRRGRSTFIAYAYKGRTQVYIGAFADEETALRARREYEQAGKLSDELNALRTINSQDKPPVMKVCAGCGNSFTVPNTDRGRKTKCCSRACFGRLITNRNKERAQSRNN